MRCGWAFPGASAGINIAQRLGLNPTIIADARAQQNTQTQDIAHFLDQLHSQLDAVAREREELRRREQEVAREKSRLESEGLKEWRAKVRDLESQLQSLLKDFTYQMRETVRAIDDRAAQQKLSKEAERRMARCGGSSASNSTPSWWPSTAGPTGETATRSRTWCGTSPWETR